MARVWQIQEAKNKFSEVVDEAVKAARGKGTLKDN
jgi:hypothetical protein